MAIRILIKRTITNHDIDTANDLLWEYGRELIKLYGSTVMKPNHHYATHVGDCTCNFGPLHDFWTFLFERLNKILKSFKANNHANSKLESMFFKEFHRTCETSRVKVTHEERGTVAGLVALSQELNEISMDGQLPIHVYSEILEIFQVDQHLLDGKHSLWLAWMRWFKPYEGNQVTIWDKFSTLGVRLWELGEYQEQESPLPSLVDLDWIKNLVAMTIVTLGENQQKVWATVDLAKGF
ncbi:hypothetical protein M404DRAFT_36018 [Pisolithus tinctorius Marx 270]|uniref:Uncharacterized protein n=1 Tax=Pisolithus tinctorius Marx 270 TaxID=870435 RepID=A0A0C3I8T1_PISTI|nr:hypothetical protein M404DRAFT_36018 [Pisolithus tinctorius Marx 270]